MKFTAGLIAITLLAGSSTMYAARGPGEQLERRCHPGQFLRRDENAVVQSRTLAIVHVAIHDALNTIDPRYERYAYPL